MKSVDEESDSDVDGGSCHDVGDKAYGRVECAQLLDLLEEKTAEPFHNVEDSPGQQNCSADGRESWVLP